jgi:hypothetical protein
MPSGETCNLHEMTDKRQLATWTLTRVDFHIYFVVMAKVQCLKNVFFLLHSIYIELNNFNLLPHATTT